MESLLLRTIDKNLDPPFLLIRAKIEALNTMVELDVLIDSMAGSDVVEIAQNRRSCCDGVLGLPRIKREAESVQVGIRSDARILE